MDLLPWFLGHRRPIIKKEQTQISKAITKSRSTQTSIPIYSPEIINNLCLQFIDEYNLNFDQSRF